jgi:hypothetical protein
MWSTCCPSWRAKIWSSLPDLGRRLRDGALVVRVAGVAASVPLLMRLPLSRLERLLEPRAARGPSSAAHQARVLRLVNTVLEVGRPVLRTTCLTRGITRYYFFKRAGIDVALVFGIGQPTPGPLAGHCWLVKDDEPFLEVRDPRPVFTETYRLEPRP